jgi:hypothetical protein
MRNDREFLWYMLVNVPGFGTKSIHYLYERLLANNMTIHNLFALEVTELYHFFPEIGKGKFSKIKFSSFPAWDNDPLYRNYLVSP